MAGAPASGLSGLYAYVQHEDIEQREREGWILDSELMAPHGDYSVLMKFVGDAP